MALGAAGICAGLGSRLESNKEEEGRLLPGIKGENPGVTVLRVACRGTSLIRNRPPPEDHHRAPGIGLLEGPREGAVAYERGAPVTPLVAF